MPPNKKGGKNYKKGKHAEPEAILHDCLDGQMYGRIIKLLGGCNAIVYCNDNRERLCHIRGTMRKKVWLATGDIVLISLRDLNSSAATSSIDRGDICAKYEKEIHKKLKEKDRTINPLLFTSIETAESTQMNGGGGKSLDDGLGYEFDDASDEEDDEDDSDSEEDGNTKQKNIVVNPGPDRRAQKKAMQQSQDDDDIDIDAI
jgi:translation initiation factor 1A